MTTSPASTTGRLSSFEQLRYARQIIQRESEGLLQLSRRLDRSFCRAIELLCACRGAVIVSGMGKAGLVGQKIAATLASTGTRSHFLHPAEAVHGDLGRIHRQDVMLILSHSGETEEVVRLLPSLRDFQVAVIAMTGHPDSHLARGAAVVLDLGHVTEACSMGLAPSTSTTTMLALGDALALVSSRMHGFTADGFARFHPGGSLGRQLAKVEDAMRPLERCRIADQDQTVRQVLIQVGRPGRRTGAVMLTGKEGRLTGIFTDSDLARLFESHRDTAVDQPIREVMSCDPTTVSREAMMNLAVEVFVQKKISELPVVDSRYRPCGLIDITDVVGLLPREPTSPAFFSQPSTATRAEVERDTVIPFPNQGGGGSRSNL